MQRSSLAPVLSATRKRDSCWITSRLRPTWPARRPRPAARFSASTAAATRRFGRRRPPSPRCRRRGRGTAASGGRPSCTSDELSPCRLGRRSSCPSRSRRRHLAAPACGPARARASADARSACAPTASPASASCASGAARVAAVSSSAEPARRLRPAQLRRAARRRLPPPPPPPPRPRGPRRVPARLPQAFPRRLPAAQGPLRHPAAREPLRPLALLTPPRAAQARAPLRARSARRSAVLLQPSLASFAFMLDREEACDLALRQLQPRGVLESAGRRLKAKVEELPPALGEPAREFLVGQAPQILGLSQRGSPPCSRTSS